MREVRSLPPDFGVVPAALAGSQVVCEADARTIFSAYRLECVRVLDEKCRNMQQHMEQMIDMSEARFIASAAVVSEEIAEGGRFGAPLGGAASSSGMHVALDVNGPPPRKQAKMAAAVLQSPAEAEVIAHLAAMVPALEEGAVMYDEELEDPFGHAADGY